jgi:hypothetical protein
VTDGEVELRTLDDVVLLAGGYRRVAQAVGTSETSLRHWVSGAGGANFGLRQMFRVRATLATLGVDIPMEQFVDLALLSRAEYRRRLALRQLGAQR